MAISSIGASRRWASMGPGPFSGGGGPRGPVAVAAVGAGDDRSPAPQRPAEKNPAPPPRLDRGPDEDDPADLLLKERRDGHGHGEVRFSRARRADADDPATGGGRRP